MLFVFLVSLVGATMAKQCGRQTGGALCPNNLCCSQYGWCGNTDIAVHQQKIVRAIVEVAFLPLQEKEGLCGLLTISIIQSKMDGI
ncbi:hypothetical protein Godav_028147 [Gossypium davidsonii]|uniref:Chitin-binding type-1 domain-containing protein n=2 Tax=Gossypium TaxID=3633 RepID=A0A7J8RYD7_GOSDV|nr:hypothetical protein [Gossypium davidsonii]MBA0654240.1 hypothetical protein [Gossypium klotzschianum]